MSVIAYCPPEFQPCMSCIVADRDIRKRAATMEPSGQKLSVIVVPGSGTGELKGIAGTFDIQIANGQHSYTLEYSLPK